MTVADLHPASLFALIVFGCAFGVYMPMVFMGVYKDRWHIWPWQTKAYFVFAAVFLVGGFFLNFYIVAKP